MRIRHLFTLLLLALGAVFSLPASASVRMVVNGQEQNTYTDLGTALTMFQAGSDDVVEFFCDRTEDLKQAAYVNKAADIVIHVPNIQCFDDYALRVNGKGVRVTLDVEGTFLGNLRVENYGVVTIRNVEYFQGYCEIITEGTLNVEGGNYICINGSTLFDCGDSHAHVCLSGGTFHLDQYQKVVDASADGVTFAEGYGLYDADSGERVLPGIGQSVFGMMQNLVCIPSDDAACISTANYSVAFNSFDMALNASARISSVPFTLTLLKDVKIEPYDWSNETPLYYYGGEVTIDLQGYKLTADFSNAPAIYAEKSSLTLKAAAGGGIVNPSGSLLYSNGGSLTVESGKYKAAQNGFVAEGTKVRIEEGEFEAANVAFDYSSCTDVVISGGHFLSTATDYPDSDNHRWPAIKSNGNSLPEGYIFVGHFPEGDIQCSDMYGYLYRDGNSFYDVTVGVGDPVVEVLTESGKREFASLSAAFKAAAQAESASITMLKDADVNSTITLTAGNVNFDFEGHKLTSNASNATFVVDGGSLTVVGGNEGNVDCRNGNSTVFDCKSGTLVFESGLFASEGVVVTCNSGSNVIINGGVFVSKNSTALLNNCKNTMLAGGEFISLADNTSIGAITLDETVKMASGYTFVIHESAGNFQVRTTSGMRSVWSDVLRRPAVDVSVEEFVNYATLITPDGKETDYMYFEEAMDAAQQMERATVRLNANVAFCDESLYRSYVINSGDITLDCDNHILLSASRYALDLRGGKLTIEGSPIGGVYQLSAEEFGSSISQCAINLKSADGASNSSRPQLVINSGYFRFPAMGIVSIDGGVEVNGGTFEGGGSYFFMYHGKDLVLKGGTFIGSDNPITCWDENFWIPEGYVPINPTTGDKVWHHDMGFIVPYPYNVTIIKPEPVVEVATAEGTEGFTDFYEAYKYAENQSAAEITLLKDITLKTPIQQEDGNIVLNLGNYTITYSGKDDKYDRVFSINWGSLTVNASPQGGIRSDFGNIFTIYYSRSLTINGGHYEASDVVVYGSGGTSLNITDGTFVSTNNSAILLDYSENHNLSGGHYISPEGQPAVDGRGRDLARGYAYYDASITPYMEMQTGSARLPRTKDFEFPNDIVVMPCLAKATLDCLDGSDPVEYYNMHDAITDARDTDREVKLVNDMVLTTALYHNRGDIRFDLNGHTIMCYDGAVLLPGEGTITVCGNGTIICPDAYGIFYLDAEEMDEDEPGAVIVEDGTFIGRQLLYADMGSFIFHGGTFVGEIGMQCYDDSQVEMRGGTLITSDYPLLNGNDQELLPAGYQFYNASNQPLIYSRAQNKLKEEDMSDAHYVTVHQPGAPVAGTISALSHIIETAKQGLVKLDTINALVNAALGR